MQKRDGRIIYSPTDLINFMESEFASWMDHLHMEDPDRYEPDKPDEATKIIQEHGDKHEREFLETLRSQQVYEINDKNVEEARRKTIEAMESGAPVIYQGVLSVGEFEGKSDFLNKVPGKSVFGDYLYEVWDTKLARKPKPYFLVQLCCYAEMLENMQGKMPERISVVLGTQERKEFRTSDYFYFYRSLKEAFLEYHANFDPEPMPEWIEVPDFSRWKSHADAILAERDSLVRVANIRKGQIKKLHACGIDTMSKLAACESASELAKRAKLSAETADNLVVQAQLQVASASLPQPEYRVLTPSPEDPRRGLALLPPSSANDVFFDMEGYPLTDGGLEYLFGATYMDNGLQFKDWWAHNRAQEKIAFEQWIDWVYARWIADPKMHIYHYAPYEVTAMRRLMGRHGTREHEVDQLLRNNVFVDLYSVVRNGLRVGEPKYSIKNLEHIYAAAREGAVANASESIVYYERWLEAPDGADHTTSKTLQEIRDYNRVDCDSTYHLTEWLRKLQAEHGIAYLGKAKDSEEVKEAPDNAAAKLAAEMQAQIPADRSGDEERWRVWELLSHLLEFYRREMKPVFWRRYDWAEMTDEELIADPDCLGGLQRTSRAPEPLKKSKLYEYRFDPQQETKLSKGSKCVYADLSGEATIHELDRSNGVISVKVGPKSDPPPEPLNLIPNEFVSPKVLEQSVQRTIRKVAEGGKLPSAIEDFLHRREPNIAGRAPGSDIIPADASVEQIADRVGKLSDSTICIQGPPGCGKTYTGARIIASLVKAGKRVGITSNSHKVIDNLTKEVLEVVTKERIGASLARVWPSDGEDSFLVDNGVISEDTKSVFDGPYDVIGGTAWCFASDSAKEIDYLFVDEAGQVTLAHLLAMSPCTKNIVLLGDQMQLEQPIQGSHPGESGQSALKYLLQEHQTVPKNLGIFLGISYRMHSDVCKLISEVVYEGRLKSEPKADNRTLVGADGHGRITKNAGIQFIPVPHEGNTQSSIEEAQVIAQLVEELTGYKWIDDNGRARSLTKKDILIVAPYNVQARLISDLCPGVSVASVDKFQGQEAPVVILSMCTSDPASSPRGLDFIFSQNRLNVAISRAKTLAVIVGSPELAKAKCNTVDQIKMANFYCRIVQDGLALPIDRKAINEELR